MSYFIVILVPILLAVLYIAFAGVIHIGGKILFCLLAAARLNQELQLVSGGGFGNYAAWAGILLALSFLLFWLPRASRCMDFTSAYFWIAMFGLVISDALIGWLTPDTQVNTMHFFLMFLLSAISGGCLTFTLGKNKDFSVMLFRGADRILASAIMGFVFSYSGTQIFSYVEGTTFFWVLAGVFAVLWYVVDVFAFPQLIKVAAKIEEEVAAEMVAGETASNIDYEDESPEQLEKRLKKEERQEEKRKWREEKRKWRDRERKWKEESDSIYEAIEVGRRAEEDFRRRQQEDYQREQERWWQEEQSWNSDW